MKLKYTREATEKEITELKTTLSENLYNPYYFHFYATDYTVNMTGKNNGFGWKWMTILNNQKKSVGIIQISRQELRTNAKLGFLVYKKYSGKGYGTRAIKEIIDLCWSIGIDNIILETTSERLCSYYKKHGFNHVGTIKQCKRLPNWEKVSEYYLQLLKHDVLHAVPEGVKND